jgi:hypothetical protein
MKVIVLTLVMLFSNHVTKTVAIQAPSQAICEANKPYVIADYYRKDEKIVAINGDCHEIKLMVPV